MIINAFSLLTSLVPYPHNDITIPVQYLEYLYWAFWIGIPIQLYYVFKASFKYISSRLIYFVKESYDEYVRDIPKQMSKRERRRRNRNRIK